MDLGEWCKNLESKSHKGIFTTEDVYRHNYALGKIEVLKYMLDEDLFLTLVDMCEGEDKDE